MPWGSAFTFGPIHLSWAPWDSKLYVPYRGACFPVGRDLDSRFSFWTPRVALSRGNNTCCPPLLPPTQPHHSPLDFNYNDHQLKEGKQDCCTVCGPESITDSIKKSTVRTRSDFTALTRLDFWTPLFFSLISPRLSRLNSTSYKLLTLLGLDRNDQADETTGDAARVESAAPRRAEDRLRVTGWSGYLLSHWRVFWPRSAIQGNTDVDC